MMILTDEEYQACDMTDLARLIRDKQITEQELQDQVLARIDRVNPSINAIVATYDVPPPAAPGEGPFAGVPFFIKDLYAHVEGQITTGACQALANNVVDHDSEIIRRYRRAGLRILGRSNTCEFGTLGTCEPVLHGPTRNPWSLDHSSGGSSGGAGALVAARILPAAHGGDGAGSIRIPASCCGVFGLKPTRGRNSLGPDLGEGLSGIVAEHVLSLSVRDSAALLDATAGPSLGDPYTAPPPDESFLAASARVPGRLRIGLRYDTGLDTRIHADCRAAVDDAAALLQDLGHEVIETQIDLPVEEFRTRYARLWSLAGTRGILAASAATGRPADAVAAECEPFNQFLYARGTQVSAAQYLQDHAWFHAQSRRICAHDAKFDMVLSPTLGTPPPTLGHFDGAQMSGETVMNRFFTFLGFTLIANLTGQPAVSLPTFWNGAGLPVGVQLTAGFGQEGALLAISRKIEQANDWKHKRPEMLSQGGTPHRR
ncbi:amidase [Phaeobacter porticola]|uniref:Amidase-like protein n=1 Tax=Phaeobacter porticola TaxID=1844006 RepID=A0A1L3IAG9_9RHOB|nr:amidase [Phaeobacter porticola]APG49199.1 amidase-like protein [Phaeobacter porticola]